MRRAYELARGVWPEHASRFSRHDFTEPQLFACLVLREMMRLSYRKASVLLADSPAWLASIGMTRAPDHNTLWRAFMNPGCRASMVDWEEAVRRMVAEYRAAMAEHVAEPAWKCLVSRLSQASPEFARIWERHEVANPENRLKRWLHPEVGLLRLNYTHLWLGQRLGTRMTTYTPADAETESRLRDLSVLYPAAPAAALA